VVDSLLDKVLNAQTNEAFDAAFQEIKDTIGLGPEHVFIIVDTNAVDESKVHEFTQQLIDASNGKLDDEHEETFVAPEVDNSPADNDDDELTVTVGTDGIIGIHGQGSDLNIEHDQAARLMDKLSWALTSGFALRDRTPF
jgi:hypothetical protein